MRDFVYDEQALEAGKNQITKLEETKKKQFVSILDNSYVMFLKPLTRMPVALGDIKCAAPS